MRSDARNHQQEVTNHNSKPEIAEIGGPRIKTCLLRTTWSSSAQCRIGRENNSNLEIQKLFSLSGRLESHNWFNVPASDAYPKPPNLQTSWKCLRGRSGNMYDICDGGIIWWQVMRSWIQSCCVWPLCRWQAMLYVRGRWDFWWTESCAAGRQVSRCILSVGFQGRMELWEEVEVVGWMKHGGYFIVRSISMHHCGRWLYIVGWRLKEPSSFVLPKKNRCYTCPLLGGQHVSLSAATSSTFGGSRKLGKLNSRLFADILSQLFHKFKE